jgi:uncharacterized protein (TIGR02246 family)
MKTAHLLVFAVLGCTCLAQKPSEQPPEKAEIDAQARAYEKAYAQGDAKTLAAFFTDDAEYTGEDGNSIAGRDAIESALGGALKARKGGTIAIEVNSVRTLAPEVLVEKGATTVTAKDGETSSSLYTAINVKKDGKWKISQLVESPVPEVSPHERLAGLAWMIGKWEESDKADDLSIESEYVWARGGNFITRNVTVKRAGETTLEGWQIIGWDPVEENIRSWTYDGEGGFAEGRWTREGDRWLLREIGVTPDGSRTGADNTFTKLSDDRITWESNNRTLDGVPQPNIGRIEIKRVKGN